ncbi:MAG TPA: hypothetical protein PK765_02280 [bacterium]|nr:hypothetical protein [bacterium]
MRGVLVSFGTILLTSLLIFYSGIESDAKRSNSFSVESAEINFENTGGTYIGAYNENEKAYSWKPLDTESGLAEGGDTFYFRKLSAVDGVYSESDSTGSIIVTEIATGSAKIEIGSGRYVFSLQDPFRSYEVVTNTATFRPLGAGTFFIDNRDERHAAYSFSALLEVSLPLDTKTTATKFTLFPTLLFEYDPRYTRSLRGADMLRIATVDSIRSLDARKEEPLADIV